MLLDLHTGFSGGRSGGLVFPCLEEFSTVCCDLHKDIEVVSKAEIDVFLELFCFFNDPTDVGNLISGSSGKGQFSFLSQRKAMPKNAQTTAQLHATHMLPK